MGKYTFEYQDTWYDGKESTEVSMTLNGPETWPEVTDFFLQYLRACGFILNESVLKDYVDDQLSEYIGAIKERDYDYSSGERGSVINEGGHDAGA